MRSLPVEVANGHIGHAPRQSNNQIGRLGSESGPDPSRSVRILHHSSFGGELMHFHERNRLRSQPERSNAA